MTPAVLILAAGRQTRMQFPSALPKQLLVFLGETLLARQVRLVSAHQLVPTVVTNDPQVAAASPAVFGPADSTTILQTLRSTRFFWPDRTIILLGDVFYSPELITDIIMDTREIRFWLKGAEILALAFDLSAAERIMQSIEDCITQTIMIYDGQPHYSGDLRLWHLLRALNGLDIHRHGPILNDMTLPEVADYSTDIDSEVAYHDFTEALTHLNLGP